MQVSRWGNSLAIRLPAAVVEALGRREGDEIAIEVAGRQHFRVARDPRRDEALETLRNLGWVLPEGFRFDRDEANARGAWARHLSSITTCSSTSACSQMRPEAASSLLARGCFVWTAGGPDHVEIVD